MENVPLEASNEDGVKLILGNSCILDRLDSRTMSRESSEFLTCWVWMADLDELPRAMEYYYFVACSGQAMAINGLPSPTHTSTPPVGKLGEKVILVHLVQYEDWRPHSPSANSAMSSENGSLAPMVVAFDWHPGVLDSRQLAAGRQPRLGGCGALAAPTARHEPDPDETCGRSLSRSPTMMPRGGEHLAHALEERE
jgi:hypothetical protein